MSGKKGTGTERPALKIGGLIKVTNPARSHFGQVGLLRTVITNPEGAPIGLRPFWIEFTDRVGLHHCHTQCDFARDDVEPYESEDTEPQELVAAETPQAEIERLRKVLDEVQTNQAEHAAHLDQLAHRADLERAERAADRMRLNALAQEVKELRAVLADIMGRVETLEVKDIQRSADLATANKATDLLAQSSKDLWRKVWKIEEAIDAMHYRRMVGNLFRRVADLVDGG